MIQIDYSQELAATLDALGIAWRFGTIRFDSVPESDEIGANRSGLIDVTIDDVGDALLERLVGQLSAIRWRYQPGRTIQIAMDLGHVN